ncbi:putative En/Spm-like transposon protein [Cucumis melo var. makuwa]|uniref:En/Spm-like transposon protein n=1 Tax=Cucumis melo var. makuwa TaxID=1194695 RepID=A0A5A7V261_CUCMM|nr:putative En/Spm-like transposon protein [Cucumis melo var. makuwa]
MSYTGYIINGKRFHAKSVEKSTQNSGIAVDATTLCRSSAKDKSQVMDVIAYYGVLQEIILLDYYVYQLPFFKCDWANVRPPRGFHDLEMYDENYDDTLVSNENISNAVEDVDESDELTYARQDCEGVFI